MAVQIDTIPVEERWQEATKGLTGAVTAILNFLKNSVSQEAFDQFQTELWSQAGTGAKELANNLGLATDEPKDIEEIKQLLIKSNMGPEFKFEVAESSNDRCVGRTTKCAWYERREEQGITADLCSAGHQGYGEGVVKSINPNFTFKLTKNMQRGDQYCEWVIERKK